MNEFLAVGDKSHSVGRSVGRSVGQLAVKNEPAICNSHLPYPWVKASEGGRGGSGTGRRGRGVGVGGEGGGKSVKQNA